MSIPVSSGIGTGAAQVYDTSRSYNAMSKVLDANADLMEYQNKMAALKKKDEQEQKEKDYTKIAALKKGFEVDYGNMKPVHADLTLNETKALLDKYEGKWQQILSGDPTVTNEFYKDRNNLAANVSKRVETWKQQKAIAERLNQNPDKYKGSQFNTLESMLLDADTDMTKYNGLFGEKLVIGDPYDESAKLHEAILTKKKTSTETDKGIYANQGTQLEDYNVSYPEWKKNVQSTPELLARFMAAHEEDSDVEKDERGIPTLAGQETILKKAFDLTRSRIKESTDIVSTTKEPKENGGGKTPYDKYKFEPFTSGTNKGFVIANTSGTLTPIQISIINKDGSKSTLTGVPAEIYKDDKGKMRTRFTKLNKVINDRNEESFVAGETVDIEVGDKGSFAAKVKGTYGQDPFSVWDNMYKDKYIYIINGTTYTKEELMSNGWTENDLKQIK